VRFPYFFYDFDRIGAVSLVYIGALLVFFLMLGHIFYLFDRKIRKKVSSCAFQYTVKNHIGNILRVTFADAGYSCLHCPSRGCRSAAFFFTQLYFFALPIVIIVKAFIGAWRNRICGYG